MVQGYHMSSPLSILHEPGSPISELVYVQPEAFWKLVSTVSNFHRGAQLPICHQCRENPPDTPNRKPPDRGVPWRSLHLGSP